MPARKPSDAALSDELNNNTTRKYYPKREENSKTCNEEFAFSWDKKYVPLNPLNQKSTHK